ncbi:MAG: hypothetical protein DPW09_33310 [Anaerolineae bacterium]|nr:hypothetical protein [Anaerolineales bacterium]MCQ3978331.1 hypothetical protein [Anaerolineae bacterium]
MPPTETKQKETTAEPTPPYINLPCGCKIVQFNHHGIKVHYCARHTTHFFSPRFDGTDVIYFVTEDQRP